MLETETIIKDLLSDDKQSRLQYYDAIDNLVGRQIVYYGMNVLVDSVFKYIKHKHFYEGVIVSNNETELLEGLKLDIKEGTVIMPHSKAIYIVKILDEKDITEENGGYMFMDTAALSHSIELEKEFNN